MLNLVFNMGSHKLSGFVNFLPPMKDGNWAEAKAQLIDSAADHEEPERIARTCPANRIRILAVGRKGKPSHETETHRFTGNSLPPWAKGAILIGGAAASGAVKKYYDAPNPCWSLHCIGPASRSPPCTSAVWRPAPG